MLIDALMPRYDFHEVHSIVIRAKPANVIAAIKAVTPREMPLVGTLSAIRALPNRLLGRGPGIRPAAGRSLWDQALQAGFVILGEAPQQEIDTGRRTMKAIVVTDQAAGAAGRTRVGRPEPGGAGSAVGGRVDAW